MTSADAQEGAELRAEATSERRTIGPEPLTVEIVPNERMREQIGTLTAAGVDARTLRLEVEGVTSEWNPEVGIRVFLNLPQADASTSTDDPHYVTTFTFFEHKGGEHGDHAEDDDNMSHGAHEHDEDAPQTFYANLTPTIQDLHAAGLYREGEPLQTTLLTVPIAQDRESKGEFAGRTFPFTGVAVSLQE
jgi:Protein of unknown function (DUF_B2219)